MRAVRCAIYTRKSSDEGLVQGFNCAPDPHGNISRFRRSSLVIAFPTCAMSIPSAVMSLRD